MTTRPHRPDDHVGVVVALPPPPDPHLRAPRGRVATVLVMPTAADHHFHLVVTTTDGQPLDWAATVRRVADGTIRPEEVVAAAHPCTDPACTARRPPGGPTPECTARSAHRHRRACRRVRAHAGRDPTHIPS